MICEGYGQLISKWVDGEAQADEARRAEAHVASCAACRRLADEFRRNAGLLESALGPEPFGQQVAGHVFSSIARREALWRWGARLAAAAAVFAAILLIRSEREKERELFRQQIVTAGLAVDRLAEALEAERARPREVVREYVYLPHNQLEGPAHPSGLPENIGPIPEVAEGVREEPKAIPRERPPGTVAMDRVDGNADWDSGTVDLSWTLNQNRGSFMTCTLNPVYFVYRRAEGESAWGEPINETALTDSKFTDRTARGMTIYEYRVVSVGAGLPHVSDDVARVKTHPDVRFEFKGREAIYDDQAKDATPRAERYLFCVQVHRDGKWLEETFHILPGEMIGGPVKNVDFSTGIRFEQAGIGTQPMKGQRRFAVLETQSGRVFLWAGVRAEGAVGRLLAEEPAK